MRQLVPAGNGDLQGALRGTCMQARNACKAKYPIARDRAMAFRVAVRHDFGLTRCALPSQPCLSSPIARHLSSSFTPIAQTKRRSSEPTPLRASFHFCFSLGPGCDGALALFFLFFLFPRLATLTALFFPVSGGFWSMHFWILAHHSSICAV
jgi:hypothetical protein